MVVWLLVELMGLHYNEYNSSFFEVGMNACAQTSILIREE